MAGGTDGQIITFDASGDPVAVGPGSDGQVLTSTGAGSPPAFEAVSGGADTDLSNLSTDGEDRACQVWVNFNGTGTPEPRDDFNVSTITDNGTGDYTINFSNAMADVNYSAVGHSFGSGNANWANVIQPSEEVTSIAVGSLRVRTGYSNGSSDQDITHIHVLIFGTPS